MNIEGKIARLIDRVKSGALTPKQIVTLYDNAKIYEGASEEQLEPLIAAIESNLRVKHPASAKKMFGSKDDEAREILAGVLERARTLFDLSGNRVGSGVKTGGDMIAGRLHVDVYISYKNADGWSAGLGYVQDTPHSLPYLRFKLYQKGDSNPDGKVQKDFKNGEQEAVDFYLQHLGRIAPSL